MVKKEQTHIYTLTRLSPQLDIGDYEISEYSQLTLFAKTLPLTSDLKRLPVLLGINMKVLNSPDMSGEIVGGGVEYCTVTGVLLNGTYDSDDFINIRELLADERASDDIIGIVQGYWGNDAAGLTNEIQDFAWDYEGEKILYDTVSVLLFMETEVVVANSAISHSMATVVAIMEIDWKPVSVKEVQEFIMEHIYARQGD